MIAHLGWSGPSEQRSGSIVWTSHEALILDYEVPLVRRDDQGQRFLSSTHWPWIGDRTRQIDGAHVALLAAVTNPVVCKVGPRTSIEELIGLCDRLDPDRESGRLTLISRLGAGQVERLLPSMVERIRAEGHPVIWLCDPMHGNTLVAPCGLKTRFVDTMMREIAPFRDVVSSCGGIAGGLHLETTPDDVTECVWDERGVDGVGTRYTSLCDPGSTRVSYEADLVGRVARTIEAARADAEAEAFARAAVQVRIVSAVTGAYLSACTAAQAAAIGGNLSRTGGDGIGAGRGFAFGIGPALSLSFPHSGAARARVRQARGRAEAALAVFDGTIVTALKEVEQALAADRAAIDRQVWQLYRAGRPLLLRRAAAAPLRAARDSLSRRPRADRRDRSGTGRWRNRP